MTWFLSLFAQFRHLAEQMNSATTEKLILQDRLDALMNDRAELWRLLERTLEGERTAYQCQLNVQWQQKGFGAPYPDAPKLDSNSVQPHGGGTAGRPMMESPSQRMARYTEDFIRSQAQ
jgi:hypothetical protein